MSYFRAHGSLIHAELVTNRDEYTQAKYTSQQPPTPVFTDHTSPNSTIQKLRMLALKLRDDCYSQEKPNREIIRDFLIRAEQIRSELL